jgi:TolB-like protein/Tfp pilus assembly protein PilF
MARLQHLLKELRRRRIFRASGIYIVAAWVTVQVASLVFPAVDVPDAALRYVWLAVILLFPLVIIFASFYDITPNGITRTPPAAGTGELDLSLRRSDYIVITALAAVGIGIAWQLTATVRKVEPGSTMVRSSKDVSPNSIAVLPLENLSGDPEQQYFVSGMQDALIAGLSRVKALRVTSKTSTLRFRNTLEALPSIAAQLGVAKLIEGSIFRVDDRVRITVKLVDAGVDAQIWSQTFENDIRDVLSLQSEVAQAIARQVEVTLSPGERARLSSAGSVVPAAYEAFLKGQFHVERFTPQDMLAAGQYFQQAVELDLNNALAHYGLSKLCGFQAQAGVITPEEAHERCLPPIERALELDDSLPESHLGYATIMTWQRFDWAKAEPAFERAIELNPSYAEARMFYSHFLALMGRAEDASEHMRLALDLDPLNPFVQGLYGALLLMIDDYHGAIDVTEDVMASAPGFGFGHIILWQAYHELGERDKAISAAARHFRVTRGDPTGAVALEEAYVDGDYSGALRHAAEVLAEHSKSVHVPPMTIGMLYEQAGDIDEAINWFEISYRKGDPDAPYLGVLTKSVPLHSHARFIQLLRDMKLDYWADRYSRQKT